MVRRMASIAAARTGPAAVVSAPTDPRQERALVALGTPLMRGPVEICVKFCLPNRIQCALFRR